MNFFDAHNHLNDELFEPGWREVVDGARKVGVVGMINNGGNVDSSRRAVAQAAEVDEVYAAVGIHPEDLPLDRDLTEQLAELSKLAGQAKVVAIGELGLDYTLDIEGAASRIKQLALIEPQLALADKLDLPVVLHVRDVPGGEDCFDDVLSLLDNFRLRGQFHCWTGDLRRMEQVLERGFYISFSGILTYPSAGTMVEVAARVPGDRMLVETDGPYLVPEPRRAAMRKEGLRNNERLCLPEYVTMTAEKLASVRGESLEVVAQQTRQNAEQLFAIKTA